MACQTNFFFRIEMGPTIFENWVMEIENWVMRIANPNSPLYSDQVEDECGFWGLSCESFEAFVYCVCSLSLSLSDSCTENVAAWRCRKSHQWAIWFQHARHQTCPTQKKTLQSVQVWYQPKTLWRLSQKRDPTMLESMSFREIVRTFFLRVFGFL